MNLGDIIDREPVRIVVMISAADGNEIYSLLTGVDKPAQDAAGDAK